MNSLQRRRLLETVFCGAAVLATPVVGQIAFKASPVIVGGDAQILQGISANHDDVIINTASAPTAVINWTPSDVAIGGPPISLLPSGSSVTFSSNSGSNYTVFNRILPADPSRPVRFDGLVTGVITPAFFNPSTGLTTPAVPGGSVWFYSPGGIIVGPNAVFDIGSLVLTTNDIDQTGGLFGSKGEIRFGSTGGNGTLIAVNPTAAISVSALAQIRSVVPGSYVALVAPRVVQSGTINIPGSIGLIGAEAANVRINNGLFDIAFLAGTSDANGVVHTGTTGGPPAPLSDPNRGVYLAALPKNTAITMLVGGNMGYGAVAAGVINDTVALTAGTDVFAGNPAQSFAPTSATGSININANATKLATNFTSGLRAVATGAVTVDPAVVGGTINFSGPAVLTGNSGVAVNASQGSVITAQSDLTLDASSFNGAGASAVLSSIYDPALPGVQSSVNVAGNLLMNSSATASSSAAFGGSAAIVASNGIIAITGTTTLNASATGFSADVSNGDGNGGAATITSTGSQSLLTFSGNVALSADGNGGAAASPGGNPAQAGTGTGGIAELSNGGGTISFANVSISANGSGGVGHVGGFLGAAGAGGTGVGGAAVVDFGVGVTTFGALNVLANGVGGAGASGGSTNLPGPGGNGQGGQVSLLAPTNGGAVTGATIILSANGIGGDGNTSKAATDGTPGGSGAGGLLNVSIAGGSLTVGSPFVGMADGVGGTGGAGNGVSQNGGAGGAAIGGSSNVTLLGGLLSPSGIAISASAIAGSGGSGPGAGGAGGNASGGTVVLTDSGGGNAFGGITLGAAALAGNGGNGGVGFGGDGGNAVGGSGQIDLSANETLGRIAIDASLSGGNGGSGSQGGRGGSALSSGTATFSESTGTVTPAGITVTTQASGGAGGVGDGTGGVGGNAQAGTSLLIAGAGGAIMNSSGIYGLSLNASGIGGAGGAGNDSTVVAGVGGAGGSGTGGGAQLRLNAGSVTLNFASNVTDILDASGLGGSGGAGGSGTSQFGNTGQGGAGGAAGVGVGGSVLLMGAGASTLTLANPLSVVTSAVGGLGGAAGANGALAMGALGAAGGAGGTATGGAATLDLAGNSSVVGPVAFIWDASAQSGAGGGGASGTRGGAGGVGGNANGGAIQFTLNTAKLDLAALQLSSMTISGVGGAGGNGSTLAAGIIDVNTPLAGNGGQGGTGGDSIGGIALVQASGSALSALVTTFNASATGGNAGLGGVAPAQMINTGASGPLTANYLNGLAQVGRVSGGAAQLRLNDSPTNTPSKASLGDASFDVSSTSGLRFLAAATIVGGVVQDFASKTPTSFLEAGGRTELSYTSNIGGGGLSFGNLTINNFGLDDGTLVGGGSRGIYIRNQTDRLVVAGATSLRSLFFLPTQIDIAGNGTFRSGALTASVGDLIVSYTQQSAPAPAEAIDAASIFVNAYNTINGKPGAKINSGGNTTFIATNGAINIPTLTTAGGSNATLSGNTGITLGTTAISGDAILTAVNGPVTVNNFGVSGAATINGTTVTVAALTPMTLTQASATAGALNIMSGGALTVNGPISATTDVTLQSVGAANISGPLTATNGALRVTSAADLLSFGAMSAFGDITVQSGGKANLLGALTSTNGNVAVRSTGDLILGNVNALNGDLTATTNGLLAEGASQIIAKTINLNSSDISIDASEAVIGDQRVTQSVTFTNNGAGQTFIGDVAGAAGGYQLSNAEAQRAFATNINFLAPKVGAGTGLSAAPDLTIGTLTLAASGVNIGVGGALSLTTPGTARISGVLTLNNDPGNVINITAGNAIQITAATGSININDGKGGLAGAINLAAPDIIAASPRTMAAVANATSGQTLNDILGQNDGAVNNTGYLSANTITFSVRNGAYIQNSGVDTATNSNYSARRGLTVGTGGLTIATTDTNTRIFINGRQATLTGPSFITGLDFIPTVAIGVAKSAASPITGQSGFDPRSTINGCLIGSVTGCKTNFTDGPLSRNTVDKSNENNGFGPTGLTTLVELKDVLPLGYQPLIDDPVTGAGNDDLWAVEDHKKSK